MALRTTPSPSKQRRIARRTECGNPHCTDPPVDGRRFCATHTAELARIAEDMRVESAIRGRSALRQREAMPKKRPSRPTCCSLGCYGERIPPAAFCDACQEAGAIEEDE